MHDYRTINDKEKLLEEILELRSSVYKNSEKLHSMLSDEGKKLYKKVADDLKALEFLRDVLWWDHGMDRDEIKRAEAKVWTMI